MSLLEAILLGALQGATEFLPVSSSGHLVVVQHLLGMPEAQVFFDVLLHVGTLAAVVVGYRKDLSELAAACWSAVRSRALLEQPRELLQAEPLRLVALILLGSIPTALIGIVFQHPLERLFESTRVVGFMLMVTGGLLLLPRLRKTVPGARVSFATALVIGAVQGLAITPGISRSGSTISIAMLLGVAPAQAARFSFLLSLPAIAGAALLKMRDASAAGLSPAVMALGLLSAFAVGYLCLEALLKVLRRGRLGLFSWYCFGLGAVVLLLL